MTRNARITTLVPAAAHTPAQVFNVVTTALDWLEKHPKRWTRGMYARTKQDNQTTPDHPDAFCFCALGRIAKEADIFPWQLPEYLGPIGVDASTVVGLNDTAHINKMSLAAVREYFTRKYKEAMPLT